MNELGRRTLLRSVALLGALSLSVTACGDSGADTAAQGGDATAGGKAGGKLTVWAWDGTVEDVAANFEKENPGVDVEVVNAGTGNDQYTALQNAISAGSGVPDVAQVEYYAIPQFALGKSLADLAGFGADELDGTFTPGPWNSVRMGGDAVYGLPLDSGPMALFYNKEVFDKHQVPVPTTWDEYVEAARKIHAADPNVYIAADSGDAGFTTSMIWQAGGQPYQVDGTTVSIDLQDEGSKRFAETWQQLIDEDLLSDISPWSDEWYKALGDGTLATLPTGAWMPGNFASGVPDGKGKWAVAPLPQWEAGATASAENGGSSLAVLEAGKNKELAYQFVEYAAAGDGVATRIEGGAFPATTEHLSDPEFLEAPFEYFGGQQANKILAESAANVVPGWSYLPFQVYANSVYNDHVGKAYLGETTLADGLQQWGAASETYGKDQGFTVK
ncbi:multiple sugar transport system substrate-binding protein [Kineococcus xinjiangensis]|uniref:Multiple sugar transport system substrate-binding protein n=1 Tax=Kineococcus xinjiangensis TaxID=512762 RepID=A0A2S6IEK8_9ACTN|nr:sugar ABC transporter substrate-binding protein [Kineococcus xinjiangensis]PPK92641.1 multiple sugar transport system substrate-binding protein [Kineococcus xinjiangensis]